MGAPLKISVATSKFLLSITDTSAAWIYLNKGAVIPMMVLPSLIGIMLGSFVGVRILKVAKPTFIRWMVIGILFFAGLKAISKGLESYGVTFFKEGGKMKNNQQGASEEMILYARVLERGMYAMLILMFVTFFIYLFGIIDPLIP